MYEIFAKLLDKKGVTAYRVSKETGIAASTFTDWKTGRSEPKKDKLKKIADYFGVTVEYLMTGEENRLSEGNANLDYILLTDDDIRGILIEYKSLDTDHQKMLKKYLDFLKNDMK